MVLFGMWVEELVEASKTLWAAASSESYLHSSVFHYPLYFK